MTTLNTNNNTSENTGSLINGQENTCPTSPLHEVSKNIPTLQEEAAGLGSTHDVTISLTVEEPSEEQKEMFELVKEAIENGCSLDNLNPQDCDLTMNMHFEIAKILVDKNIFTLCEHIQKFNLSQNMLFEVAKAIAAKSGSLISEYIKNFGITDSNMLFEIFKIAVTEDDKARKNIQNYGFTEDKSFDLAKLDEMTMERFERAKLDAAKDGWSLGSLRTYDLKDQNMIFEIFKIVASRNGQQTIPFIQYHDLSNDQQFKILQICFAQMASNRKSLSSKQFEYNHRIVNLVTSQAYVNNIRDFLPEKPNSKSSAAEKSDKLFNEIINSPNITFYKNGKITGDIKTLLSIRPGRTLFKRLLKANKPLNITLDYNMGSLFTTDNNLNLNCFKELYMPCASSDGKETLSIVPNFIIFAHELVHALHFFEEPYTFRRNIDNKNILSSKLDNLEEQETIIGKVGEGTLCENVFRFHFGYPLRIDHQGLVPTASVCASLGDLAKLKEMLLSDPSRLNRPDTYSLDNRAEVTPLNAAIAAHQEEISDYLFQVGVDVNAQDNRWGTTLHTAVKTKQPDLVKVLLEKGADINCKDKEKDTPLIYCCSGLCLKEEEMGQSFMALLENDHVDLNAKNSNGESALSLAVQNKNCWQVAALVEKGAEIPPDLEEKVKQYIEWYHAGIYAM